MAGTSEGRANPAIRVALPQAGSVPGGGIAGWINRWPLTARLYEPLWRHRSMSLLTAGTFTTERELSTMVQWTAPLAGLRVLDVGCSAGLYARTLAAHGAQVSALDQSLPFLREAERRATAAGVGLELVQGDAHALPFAESSFALVVVGASLNEFADPARAFAEMARVLAPGGRLWLMYARRARGLGRAMQALLGLGALRFPDPSEVDAWAAAAGFARLRSEERGPVALSLYSLASLSIVRGPGERVTPAPQGLES